MSTVISTPPAKKYWENTATVLNYCGDIRCAKNNVAAKLAQCFLKLRLVTSWQQSSFNIL